MAASIFSTGSGTPMMPVEDGKTSSKRQRKVSAAVRQVSRHARMPASPVAQLAFPALTRTMETRPPVAAMCRLPTVTGAATTWLRVHMAAALAPRGATAMARSGLPLCLIPAVTAPQPKPSGNVFLYSSISLCPQWGVCRSVVARARRNGLQPHFPVQPLGCAARHGQSLAARSARRRRGSHRARCCRTGDSPQVRSGCVGVTAAGGG